MCAVSWWCLSVGACLLHLVLIGVDVGVAGVAGGLSLDSAEQPIVRDACDCLLKTHVCHCLFVVSTAAIALASVHHSHYAVHRKHCHSCSTRSSLLQLPPLPCSTHCLDVVHQGQAGWYSLGVHAAAAASCVFGRCTCSAGSLHVWCVSLL